MTIAEMNSQLVPIIIIIIIITFISIAMEKGASSWLTAIPIKDLGFDLNKAQFWDAIKLRYDWEITDLPSVCVCGEAFSVDHAMICRRGGFVIQRHNELRDLEAEMLDMVCYDVEVEPVLQVLTGETLERGANIRELKHARF